MKNLLFIYNPKSGRGIIKAHLDDILGIFDDAGWRVQTCRVGKVYNDCRKIVKSYGPNAELVICAGGDGTLNSVVNGLMEIEPEKRPGVGFIPLGTTNDNRLNYGLPQDIKKAAYVAVCGSEFETDVGKLSESYFVYVAAFGEMAAVSCYTSQAAKSVFGRAAYIGEGLKTLLDMKSYELTLKADEKTIEGEFFLGLISNSNAIGGFKGIVGDGVNLQDGKFEVVLVKQPGDLIEFNKEIQALILNNEKNPDSPVLADGLVYRFKASKIEIRFKEKVQWVLDGEDAGTRDKVLIEDFRRAIRIMTGDISQRENAPA